MAYKGVLDDIEICLQGGVPDKLPVFAQSQIFGAVSTGYTYEEVQNDGEKLTDAIIKGIEKYDWDWAWVTISDSVTFDALGFEIGPRKGGKGNDPYIVTGHKPANYETLSQLRIVDFHKEGRYHFLFDAIKAVNRRFGDTVCTTGTIIGPMQGTSHVYGITETLTLIYDHPELLKDTIDFFVRQSIALADEMIRAGADAIFIPDLLTASYFISPQQYEQFAQPGLQEIFEHINHRGLPVFFHPNEPSVERLLLMSSLGQRGVVALTVGSEGDIIEAKRAIGDRICLMGNVRSLQTLRNSGAEAVKAEVQNIIEQVSVKGGHILNTCATMAADTPADNAMAMVTTARRYFGGELEQMR